MHQGGLAPTHPNFNFRKKRVTAVFIAKKTQCIFYTFPEKYRCGLFECAVSHIINTPSKIVIRRKYLTPLFVSVDKVTLFL